MHQIAIAISLDLHCVLYPVHGWWITHNCSPYGEDPGVMSQCLTCFERKKRVTVTILDGYNASRLSHNP